jgi:hypothetical protein
LGAYVLSDPRFVVHGRVLARSAPFVLTAPPQPVQLDSATEGVFRDGTSSPYAAYDRWASGARRVRIQVDPQPVTLHIRVGTLAPNVSAPTMGRVTLTKDATGSTTVPVPRAPFRIEVRYGSGRRGTIEFLPRP